MRARRLAARILTVAGTLLLLGASVAGWADRTLFDAENFGARARSALERSSDVRTVVARTVVRSVVERAQPGLLRVRPLVESAADTVAATPAFAAVFETAARTTAQLLVEAPDQNFVLRANEAVRLLVDTIRVYAPGVADQIPTSLDAALVSIQDVSLERELWHDAARVRELAWVLLLLGLLAWFAALLIAPDRRRAVEALGIALVVAGVVVLLGLEVGERLATGAPQDSVTRDAAGAVWRTFTEGLLALAWFGIALGAVTTAAAFAARPDRARIAPQMLIERVRVALAKGSTGTGATVVAALALGALGVAMVSAPLTVVELAVTLFGVLLLYTALVAVLELIARPAEADASATVRRRPIIAVAIVVGLVLVAGTTVALIASSPEAQTADEAVVACNGQATLCDRRLGDVTLATSHNASSAADDGYLNPNHVDGIPAQLRRGIRGFQLDTFLGTRRGGRVYTDLTDVQIETFMAEVGPDLTDRALRAREIIGPPPDASSQALYLCHVFCELGATRASDAFDAMATFLAENPNDVLVWIIEDYAPVEVLERELARARLLGHRYPLDPDQPLPTLRQMILTNRRLVVLLENQDGGVAMPNAYAGGIVQETPFTFRDAAALAAPESCRDERGSADAPLFLLNHWVTPASVTATGVVNSFAFLDERARRCQTERGLLPNLVAVDFTNLGDLDGVVDALNGFDH